jgi:hypothetical protein
MTGTIGALTVQTPLSYMTRVVSQMQQRIKGSIRD